MTLTIALAAIAIVASLVTILGAFFGGDRCVLYGFVTVAACSIAIFALLLIKI